MLLYILGGTAAVALGAWLKWAAAPVSVAFRLGFGLGKRGSDVNARQAPPRPFAVLLALVMPWRAAAEIREQRDDIKILIRTLGDLARRHDDLVATCGAPTLAELNRAVKSPGLGAPESRHAVK